MLSLCGTGGNGRAHVRNRVWRQCHVGSAVCHYGLRQMLHVVFNDGRNALYEDFDDWSCRFCYVRRCRSELENDPERRRAGRRGWHLRSHRHLGASSVVVLLVLLAFLSATPAHAALLHAGSLDDVDCTSAGTACDSYTFTPGEAGTGG